MKTINSLIAVVALSIGTLIFSGNANASFDVVPVDDLEKSLVKFVIPKNQKTYVYIISPKGDVLHEETIRKDNPSPKVFNLSNLENGIYTFYASSEQSNITKEVKVDDSFVEVISKEVEYKPTFIAKDGKLMINIFNIDQEEIEMSIDNALYDIYSNKEGNPISFNKAFDLSKMPMGNYYAMIKIGSRTYGHTFRVQ
jgi:hypothetical protein